MISASRSVLMALATVTLIAGQSWSSAYAQEVSTAANIEQGETNETALATTFVERLVAELKAVAIAKEAGEPVDLNNIFFRELDVKKMQSQLLSRSTRRKASKEQIGRYKELFPAYISAYYADNIDRLVSRRIDVYDVAELRRGGYIVKSKLFDKAGNERALIDWRLVKTDEGSFALVDVFRELQSVNLDLRAQFTSIVNKKSGNGFGDLILHMENFLEGSSAT